MLFRQLPSQVLSPIHINLSDPDGPDVQCKLNHSGIPYGTCKVGSTLSLGSSSVLNFVTTGLHCLVLFL